MIDHAFMLLPVASIMLNNNSLERIGYMWQRHFAYRIRPLPHTAVMINHEIRRIQLIILSNRGKFMFLQLWYNVCECYFFFELRYTVTVDWWYYHHSDPWTGDTDQRSVVSFPAVSRPQIFSHAAHWWKQPGRRRPTISTGWVCTVDSPERLHLNAVCMNVEIWAVKHCMLIVVMYSPKLSPDASFYRQF